MEPHEFGIRNPRLGIRDPEFHGLGSLGSGIRGPPGFLYIGRFTTFTSEPTHIVTLTEKGLVLSPSIDLKLTKYDYTGLMDKHVI